ncbi:MAG: tRNA 4-thiouridine(8) synthase ThiI, partial [Calditrichaeota bacterium]|nr:tRNA 4-thiouridine(8) synthase ThiI [Calditrichota bacterium]
NQVTSQLIFRPLIAMNKLDIIKIAQQIGTEEFAIQMPEYCGIVSQRPSTAAKLESVLHEESRFNSKILDTMLDKRQVLKINQFSIENNSEIKLESTRFIDQNDIVIDIRDPEKIDIQPLKTEKETNILEIPFYKLGSKFASLDSKKTYLLYCDNGTTSRLLALNLLDKGFTNVKVLSA